MFQAKFVEKIETHIFYPVTFSENRTIYDDKSQKNMAHGLCMLDTKDYKLRICNNFYLTTATMVARTRPIFML